MELIYIAMVGIGSAAAVAICGLFVIKLTGRVFPHQGSEQIVKVSGGTLNTALHGTARFSKK